MQQGSSNGAATATLTDEQILGLEPMPVASANGAAQVQPSVILSEAKNLSSDLEPDGEILRRPQETPQNDTAAQADPAWLAALEAQPQGGREAAAEARQWRDTARDIASLDAAYFGADPAARGDLAARLYTSDPAAFRAMLAEGARMLSERDPQALADLARQLGAPVTAACAFGDALRQRRSECAVNRVAHPARDVVVGGGLEGAIGVSGKDDRGGRGVGMVVARGAVGDGGL
jgi:hypothetical protein